MTIGVLISAHTPRFASGALARCLKSVTEQALLPDQIAVAVDQIGMGAAWCKNQALSMLSTDLVACVDSDDFLYSNHLDLLSRAFYDTDCDIAYSNWSGNNPFPEWFFTDPWDDANPRHPSTTIMVKRNFLESVGGYRESESAGCADDDWLTFMAMVEAGAKVHHVIETTWHYEASMGDNTSGLASRWT